MSHDFAGVVIGAGHERLETYKFGSVDYFGLGDERQSENGNCGHEYAFHNPPPRATILTRSIMRGLALSCPGRDPRLF